VVEGKALELLPTKHVSLTDDTRKGSESTIDALEV